jgi:DNA-binding beta-propeller fold protein YncE
MEKLKKQPNPVAIASFFLVFLIALILYFFIPKESWKFFFNINNLATAFQTNTPGYWNVTETWGSPSFIQFDNPQNLVISATGEIYVADTDIHRVDVMNSDGTASTSYNVLNNPFGIALGSDGKIYLANAHIGIVVLNADGTYLTTYSYPATDYQSIIISSDKIYLVNSASSSIDVLNMDGSNFATYENVGLAYPRGVAVSSTTGEIYVANRDNTNIVVLNSDGTASTTYNIGVSSNYDVDLSGDGRIFVTNRTAGSNGSIFVLDSNGSIIDTYSSGLGLSAPHSLFIATSGKLYITNIGGGNIGEGHITVLNNDGTLFANYNSPSYVPGYVSTEGIDYPGMSDDVTISTGVVTLNQTQNVRNVTLASGGTLNLDDFVLNVYGHWWNFVNTGGTLQSDLGSINFPSTSTDISSDTTINSGTITLTQDQYVNDITLLSGGTLNLANYILNVNGDWTRTGGTFNSTNGTVNFIGSSDQSINGESTFGNLIKNGTATSSLFFSTTATTTITGNLILNGTSNNILTISPTGVVLNYNFVSKVTEMLGGGFWGITGITSDSSNNIYTIEQGGRVGKFDSDLNYISSFTYGAAGPYNIALDSLGNIYVSEQNHSIKKFDSTGTELLTIGTYGSGDGQFDLPYGMAFDSSDNLFVVDYGNNRVQKFNSVTGAYVSQFGTAGSGDGQFSGLYGIDIDSSDNIYTTEMGNNRVQKFDSSGNYISQFGTAGSGDGQFNSPREISIDSSNNIYVADQNNNRVQKFNSSGDYVLQFGTAGSGDGQFNALLGITVDSSNNIYTTEQGNSRIQKFNLPISSDNFKILKTGSGSASFSYLNVVNSNNISIEPFYCLVGCIDGGGNTNWVFSARSSRRTVITETQDPPVLTTFRIIPENTSIALDSTKQFEAELLDQYGESIYERIYWYSSDTSVVQ